MKVILRRPGWILLSAAAALCGCEVHTVGPPPVTVEGYEQIKSDASRTFPPRVVALHNLQRAMNDELSDGERAASLRLVSHLGHDDPGIRAQLSALLSEQGGSDELRASALAVLLKQDAPDLAPQVAAVLPKLDADSAAADRVLDWLTRNPDPGALDDVVRLWARESSPTSLNEPRYRRVVEALSGRSWEEALLASLNDPRFEPRVEAAQVLTARMDPQRLRQALAARAPRTDEVAAIQLFLQRFDCFPASPAALERCIYLRNAKAQMMEDAAGLYADWRQNYGYTFQVWDFHVLSRLGRDPLRRNVRRSQLVVDLARSFIKRQHVRRAIARPAGRYDYSDQFSKHVESLSMADLWRLSLLNELLNQPQMQRALREMAEADRKDTGGAWGGLILHKNARIEADRYPVPSSASGDDLSYSPPRNAIEDLRDALCLFHGHFEKVRNSGRAGPTGEELRAAQAGAYAGLVLTSIDESSFCAHYYNPQGVAISLGKFPFR